MRRPPEVSPRCHSSLTPPTASWPDSPALPAPAGGGAAAGASAQPAEPPAAWPGGPERGRPGAQSPARSRPAAAAGGEGPWLRPTRRSSGSCLQQAAQPGQVAAAGRFKGPAAGCVGRLSQRRRRTLVSAGRTVGTQLACCCCCGRQTHGTRQTVRQHKGVGRLISCSAGHQGSTGHQDAGSCTLTEQPDPARPACSGRNCMSCQVQQNSLCT